MDGNFLIDQNKTGACCFKFRIYIIKKIVEKQGNPILQNDFVIPRGLPCVRFVQTVVDKADHQKHAQTDANGRLWAQIKKDRAIRLG